MTSADVAGHCAEKLIRRHPHVFGEVEAETAGEVLRNWDEIKQREPGREAGIFGEVPENLPGPLYARKVQRRAASSGFDFPGVESPIQSLKDELDELERASSAEERFHEVGDVLFAAVNVARKLRVDPELALRAAADRFRERVLSGSGLAASEGRSWDDLERRRAARLLRPRAPDRRRIVSDMSQIEHVHARQILDSRGNPTVEVELSVRSGRVGPGRRAIGRIDRRVRGNRAARRRLGLDGQGGDARRRQRQRGDRDRGPRAGRRRARPRSTGC